MIVDKCHVAGGNNDSCFSDISVAYIWFPHSQKYLFMIETFWILLFLTEVILFNTLKRK